MRLRPLRATLAAAPPALLPAVAVALFALAGGCRRERPALTDPGAVADLMRAQAAEDFADVRDFTVVGDEGVVYYRRVAAGDSLPGDSLPTFELRAFRDASAREPIDDPYRLPNVANLVRGIREGARLSGLDTLAGRRVYVFETTEAAPLLGLPPGAPNPPGFRARIYVDTETFRTAALRVEATAPDSTATRPVVQTFGYEDYRTTDGLPLPHRSRARFEGLDQLIPTDERMLMGGSLGAQRLQAQQLPPGPRREQALRDIDRQLRLLQPDPIEEVFVVREVRVNAGVPDSLFTTRLTPLLAP